MQIAAGLLRLGHDVHYLETTSNWPYDPVRQEKVRDSDYAVAYLAAWRRASVCGDRWAYRRSFSDRAWLGPSAGSALDLLASADAVFNVAGSTRLDEDGLSAGQPRLLRHRSGHPRGRLRRTATKKRVASSIEHDAVVTYGENIGTPASPVPPLPGLEGAHPPAGAARPLASNRLPTAPRLHDGRQLEAGRARGRVRGERYLWSKDVEFHAVIDVPQPRARRHRAGDEPRAARVDALRRGRAGEGARGDRRRSGRPRSATAGASSTRSRSLSIPWPYRDYVVGVARRVQRGARPERPADAAGGSASAAPATSPPADPSSRQDTGLRHRPADRRGSLRVPHGRRSRRARSKRSKPTTSATAAPPARSPSSTSAAEPVLARLLGGPRPVSGSAARRQRRRLRLSARREPRHRGGPSSGASSRARASWSASRLPARQPRVPRRLRRSASACTSTSASGTSTTAHGARATSGSTWPTSRQCRRGPPPARRLPRLVGRAPTPPRLAPARPPASLRPAPSRRRPRSGYRSGIRARACATAASSTDRPRRANRTARGSRPRSSCP